jgi:hypothetical protein
MAVITTTNYTRNCDVVLKPTYFLVLEIEIALHSSDNSK